MPGRGVRFTELSQPGGIPIQGMQHCQGIHLFRSRERHTHTHVYLCIPMLHAGGRMRERGIPIPVYTHAAHRHVDGREGHTHTHAYPCIPMLHTGGWMRERHTYTRAYPCVPMLHTGGGWMTLFLPYLVQFQV